MPELQNLRLCARPVVFETGIAEMPFSLAGTAFLVGFKTAIYVVTARHIIDNYPPDRLLIYPSNQSRVTLRLSKFWSIESDPDDRDASDLLLLRATLDGIPKKDRMAGQLLQLTTKQNSNWTKDRFNSTFFLFGYPSVVNEVDYTQSQIITQQFFLRGIYSGPSVGSHCHKLRLDNPLFLTDYNGLSGSPVFSLRNSIGIPTQPTFCGMALRGTSTSGSVHFLEAKVIIAALTLAHDVQ